MEYEEIGDNVKTIKLLPNLPWDESKRTQELRDLNGYVDKIDSNAEIIDSLSSKLIDQ